MAKDRSGSQFLQDLFSSVGIGKKIKERRVAGEKAGKRAEKIIAPKKKSK
jgi:hypothetical protein